MGFMRNRDPNATTGLSGMANRFLARKAKREQSAAAPMRPRSMLEEEIRR